MNKRSVIITLMMFIAACIISWGVAVSKPAEAEKAPAKTCGSSMEKAKGMKCPMGAKMKGKMGAKKGGKKGGKMKCIMMLGKMNLDHLERFVKAVEATPDQEKKLKDFIIANGKKRLALKSKKAAIKLNLSIALYGDKIDASKARSLIKEMGDTKTELKLLSLDQYLKIKEIITPEQFEKIKKKAAGMKHKRGAPPHFGKRGKPAPPVPPEEGSPPSP